MARESYESKPNPDQSRSDPSSKRGRRKDLSPEQQSELQARQRAIGQELRRIYDDVAREPIPQEFVDLLKRIERKRED